MFVTLQDNASLGLRHSNLAQFVNRNYIANFATQAVESFLLLGLVGGGADGQVLFAGGGTEAGN